MACWNREETPVGSHPAVSSCRAPPHLRPARDNRPNRWHLHDIRLTTWLPEIGLEIPPSYLVQRLFADPRQRARPQLVDRVISEAYERLSYPQSLDRLHLFLPLLGKGHIRRVTSLLGLDVFNQVLDLHRVNTAKHPR